MPSPRQIVLATLKDLTRQQIREQVKLLMVRNTKGELERARQEIEAEERQVSARIKEIRLRRDRELSVHREMLGAQGLFEDEDDGEDWKQGTNAG
jgi:hypothetical protein